MKTGLLLSLIPTLVLIWSVELNTVYSADEEVCNRVVDKHGKRMDYCHHHEKHINGIAPNAIPLHPSSASMSSTFESYTANRVVESHCSEKYQEFMSATKREKYPGWKIDLGQFYDIQRVFVQVKDGWFYSTWFGEAYVFVTEDNLSLSDDIDFSKSCAYYKGEANLKHIVQFNCNGWGRYVSIVLKRDWHYLILCDVSIHGTVAAFQPYKIPLNPNLASMSSTYKYFSASRVVGTSCDNTHEEYLSATDLEKYPVWKIDLDIFYDVETVFVSTRNKDGHSTLFSEAYAFVTEDDLNLSDDIDFLKHCDYFKGEAKNHENVLFSCNRRGRYVSIVLKKDSQRLLLCGVSIYGTIPVELSLDPNSAWSSSSVYKSDFNKAMSLRCISSGQSLVTATEKEINPRWEIDLKTIYYLTKIVVTVSNHHSANRFSEAFAFVTESKLGLNVDLEFSKHCAYFKGPATPDQKVVFPCNKSGRFVSIVLRKEDYLEMCHVSIYEGIF